MPPAPPPPTPLALDRDLLIFEPDLFRDVGWLGQRLVSGTCNISGTTLTLTAHDVDLGAAGVTTGHVAVVDGTPYEVIARLSATTAAVSRLRASDADPAIPPSPATGKPVTIATLRPQIAMVELQVMRMLGIEPTAAAEPGVLFQTNITNPKALVRVVSLGALHLIFSAAAALSPEGSPNWVRADLYRNRFADERQRTAAQIDTDGDGLPDATRRLNTLQFTRA